MKRTFPNYFQFHTYCTLHTYCKALIIFKIHQHPLTQRNVKSLPVVILFLLKRHQWAKSVLTMFLPFQLSVYRFEYDDQPEKRQKYFKNRTASLMIFKFNTESATDCYKLKNLNDGELEAIRERKRVDFWISSFD